METDSKGNTFTVNRRTRFPVFVCERNCVVTTRQSVEEQEREREGRRTHFVFRSALLGDLLSPSTFKHMSMLKRNNRDFTKGVLFTATLPVLDLFP